MEAICYTRPACVHPHVASRVRIGRSEQPYVMDDDIVWEGAAGPSRNTDAHPVKSARDADILAASAARVPVDGVASLSPGEDTLAASIRSVVGDGDAAGACLDACQSVAAIWGSQAGGVRFGVPQSDATPGEYGHRAVFQLERNAAGGDTHEVALSVAGRRPSIFGEGPF